MIRVFGLAEGIGTIRQYVASGALGLDGVRCYRHMEALSYRDLLAGDSYRFFRGTYVFTDLPLLRSTQIERVGRILRRLGESMPETRILNHPLGCRSRYELLRLLHERGINRHNAYRVDERRQPAAWPVFVRGEVGHWRSPLLENARDLARCLEDLVDRGRWLGDKLVVELNDVRSADSLYRKYGAFRIGDRIVPDHVFIAPGWHIRHVDDFPAMLSDPALVGEDYAYVRDNPHAARIMEIFELGGIEYGRIDYGLHEGRLQVWEINTSPTLLAPGYFQSDRSLRRPKFEMLSGLLHDAFARLDR